MTVEMKNSENTEAAPESKEERATRMAEIGRQSREGTRGAEPEGSTEAAEAEVPARPDNIPEKFWDAEKGEVRVDALAKSYAELEAARSKPEAGSEEASKEGGSEETAEESSAPEVIQKAVDAAAAQYAKTGELNEESRTTLKEAGFSDSQIETYLAGVKASETAALAAAHEVTGGEESFNSMMKWAESLPPDEIEGINADLADAKKTVSTIKGLYARYQLATGVSGKRLDATPSNSGSDTYGDRLEMIKDQSSELYKTSSAERARVAQKIARSKRSGTIVL